MAIEPDPRARTGQGQGSHRRVRIDSGTPRTRRKLAATTAARAL
jgi:hypothetical protein